MEPMVMAFVQLPGLYWLALPDWLPADTTTATPRLTASLMALWKIASQVPNEGTAMLRLMMSAGFAFAGAPGTETPAAQRIASAISDEYPPHFPIARTGRIFAYQLTPAMPSELLPDAAMIPAITVPCQLE